MRLSWLLVDELAIGMAPRSEEHLDMLEEQGIRAVLSLCGEAEAPPPPGLGLRFRSQRLVLPDHRAGRVPEVAEIEAAVRLLGQLMVSGPVYLHCVAGVERSPLVAMGWLIRRHGLTPMAALDTVQQLHPGTCPLPRQLAVLRQWQGERFLLSA